MTPTSSQPKSWVFFDFGELNLNLINDSNAHLEKFR